MVRVFNVMLVGHAGCGKTALAHRLGGSDVFTYKYGVSVMAENEHGEQEEVQLWLHEEKPKCREFRLCNSEIDAVLLLCAANAFGPQLPAEEMTELHTHVRFLLRERELAENSRPFACIATVVTKIDLLPCYPSVARDTFYQKVDFASVFMLTPTTATAAFGVSAKSGEEVNGEGVNAPFLWIVRHLTALDPCSSPSAAAAVVPQASAVGPHPEQSLSDQKDDADARRALGEIFQVLGKHAEALSNRPQFCDLVKQFVDALTLSSGSSSSSGGSSSAAEQCEQML